MPTTSGQPAWRVLLRSRWLVLAIVLLVTTSTAVVSKLQPPTYVSTSTLLVNQPVGTGASFDVVQANQAYARTLAQIIGSRNVADAVSLELPFAMSPLAVQDAMSFQPVNETQLIEISAQSGDPRRAEQLANTYATTFVTYVRTTIPDAAPSSGVSVGDRAVLPDSPARPRPTLYTLLALLLSLAGAVGFVLLRARLDDRLHDAEALIAEFGLPVLGTLPRTDDSELSQRLLEESVRLLATSIHHASDRTLRTIVVTSSREGEGKSTVCAELALALASQSLLDRSVLAVEADLRRPRLLDRLGLPEGGSSAPGLTSYLRDEAGVEEVAVETAFSSLLVVPSGPLPAHPSALLGFPASRSAFAELAQEGRTVVLDTPPLSVGADAALCSLDADAVLLVVDLAGTRRAAVAASLEQLTAVGARPLGFVVNRAPMRERAAAYASYARRDEGAVPRRPRLARRRPAPSAPVEPDRGLSPALPAQPQRISATAPTSVRSSSAAD